MKKVLIVCSGNSSDINFSLERNKVFVYEQVQSLRKINEFEYEYFLIKGKGLWGYIRSIFSLNSFLNRSNYDIIHAHYGYSGVVAFFQFKVPVLVTFHGSDLEYKIERVMSSLLMRMVDFSIVVSAVHFLRYKNIKKIAYIPCGVDTSLFIPIDKQAAREKLMLAESKTYILFSSGFDVPVKNYPLAKKVKELLSDIGIELIELKNKSREEVLYLLNAVDCMLLTSFHEGSPQITKEAMAVNCPIVSTDVGEVKNIIKSARNCYLTSFDPVEIANKIRLVLLDARRTNGREFIMDYDLDFIAQKINQLYHKIST